VVLAAGGASHGPAANDNASGTAVAIALASALNAGAPRNLSIELVLQGAGEGQEIGLRKYLRTHRPSRASTIVLGIAPCGDGQVTHWLSDGRLIPLRYARVVSERLDTGGYRGRGATPALPARIMGLPAIAIGCLDRHGLPPRSHQATDVATAIDQAALDRTTEFALRLVDEISAAVAPADAPATRA
jgi:hypothetical protein